MIKDVDEQTGPVRGPIARGFLSLSSLIPLWESLLGVEGVTTKVNHGLDKVRFVSPVKGGSRVRATAAIAEVEEISRRLQLTLDVTIEAKGNAKPTVVARSLQRFYAWALTG